VPDGSGATRPRPKQSVSLVNRSLRRRLAIRSVLALTILGVLLVRVAHSDVAVGWAALGLLVGVGLGLVFGRTTKLGWDTESGTVDGKIDALGVVILVLHIAFIAVKGRFVGAWVDDATAAAAIGLSLTAGALVGQVLFPLYRIRALVSAEG
jgi:hypothetical protein